MTVSEKSGPRRPSPEFAAIAREAFGFLSDLGFSESESMPTIVRYRRGDVEADVYHGRQSHELGFGVTRQGVRYSIGDLIRTTDPEAAERYRNFAARTPDGIVEGLTRLAALVRRHAVPALQGDPGVFAVLADQSRTSRETFAMNVLARQILPKADEAFRKGNYREAAELYERIQSRLGPAQLKKLIIAKDRSQS
jgi:hypothetical protein